MNTNLPIEKHPFEPFLPEDARVLMLGTFPPKPVRWAMPFYYPNPQNDMWAMMGHIFYSDRKHFKNADGRTYDMERIKVFLRRQGIAMYDTAVRVRRLKDNASDKFLDIVERVDLAKFFEQCPSLRAVVTAGEKATGVIAEMAGVGVPKMGECVACCVGGHDFTLYRMPSTSRAYPLALEKKAAIYGEMFRRLGLKVYGG